MHHQPLATAAQRGVRFGGYDCAMHHATLTTPVTYDTAMFFTDITAGRSTAAAMNDAARSASGVAR